MHDPRTKRAVDAGKFIQPVQQGVDQRIPRRPAPGVNREPLRLVDDRKVVILIDDCNRDVFGLQIQGLFIRNFQPDDVPLPQQALRGRRLAVDGNLSVVPRGA